jgi:hypothetical protein
MPQYTCPDGCHQHTGADSTATVALCHLLQLRPTWPKGFYRQAAALKALQQHAAATAALQQTLSFTAANTAEVSGGANTLISFCQLAEAEATGCDCVLHKHYNVQLGPLQDAASNLCDSDLPMLFVWSAGRRASAQAGSSSISSYAAASAC